MEQGGKQEGEMNEMFSWDSCSFSLWASGDSGGKMEVAVTEEEKGKKTTVNGGEDEERAGKGKSNVEEEEEEPLPEFHTQTERERRQRMRNMFTTLHGLIPHLQNKADKTTIVEETVNYIRVLEHQAQILQAKRDDKLKGWSNNNSITFNPFLPSSSSIIPLQHHQAISADLGYYSSSASVTPANSCPTTPKSNLTTTPLPSSIIVNNNGQNPNSFENPRERKVKLTLAPSSVGFKTFTSRNVVVTICGREAQFSICGAKKPGFYTGICMVLEKFQLEVMSFQISSDEHSNVTMATIQARATALLEQYAVEDIYRVAGAEMLPWVSS